jgi:hypothetical protein
VTMDINPGNESEGLEVEACVYVTPCALKRARFDCGFDFMKLAKSRACKPSALISKTCLTCLGVAAANTPLLADTLPASSMRTRSAKPKIIFLLNMGVRFVNWGTYELLWLLATKLFLVFNGFLLDSVIVFQTDGVLYLFADFPEYFLVHSGMAGFFQPHEQFLH